MFVRDGVLYFIGINSKIYAIYAYVIGIRSCHLVVILNSKNTTKVRIYTSTYRIIILWYYDDKRNINFFLGGIFFYLLLIIIFYYRHFWRTYTSIKYCNIENVCFICNFTYTCFFAVNGYPIYYYYSSRGIW